MTGAKMNESAGAGALLQVDSVSMRFGGHLAVDTVSFDAGPGTITGLIGPNGAGKTTLFNIITGLLEPTKGQVSFDGRVITKMKPFKRARLGIGRTFQRLELFTSLSVRDNIRVAGEIRNRWHKGRINVHAEADRIMELIGVDHLAEREITEIPTGMARRVELGRALMTHPKLLLLDEPASGQDETETHEFGELLKRLAADGTGILLVEHDVSLVMAVCEYIHVLDFGQIIAAGTPAEVRANPVVLDAYLGAGTPDDEAAIAAALEAGITVGEGDLHVRTVEAPASDAVALEPLLELVDVRAGYGSIEVLHGVSLAVPQGAVVALLGPNGGGKSTTLKVCGGFVPVTGGELRIGGRVLTGISPDTLARHGVCTIPEGKGIFPNLTVSENLRMATYTGASLDDIEEIAFSRFPRLSERRSQLAGTMSGGEQQMLAMSRALATNPAVLLLDELSMGLAPLVVKELYEVVASVSALGVSILVVEQFARTVLGVADIAAIMLSGRVTRVGRPEELEEELSSAYLGAST
jgi:branched-chain amino acid transport system ATP-binding protein